MTAICNDDVPNENNQIFFCIEAYAKITYKGQRLAEKEPDAFEFNHLKRKLKSASTFVAPSKWKTAQHVPPSSK